MIDREKLVIAIERAKEQSEKYGLDRILVDFKAVDMILELLKEQEPMQVKTDMYGNAYCPWCSTDRTIEMGAQRLHLGTQFCPYCGEKVKWDA